MHLTAEVGACEADLIGEVNKLVEMLKLESIRYRFIANEGTTQEVDCLHFYLISELVESETDSSS